MITGRAISPNLCIMTFGTPWQAPRRALSFARPRALRALGLACFGHSRALEWPCPLSSGPSGPRPRCHPSGDNTAAGACQRPDNDSTNYKAYSEIDMTRLKIPERTNVCKMNVHAKCATLAEIIAPRNPLSTFKRWYQSLRNKSAS